MTKVHYVSGSRADFGLMRRCLEYLHQKPDLEVSLVLTGQHTAPKYVAGRADIVESGLHILAEIPVTLSGTSGHEMGAALAVELLGFLELWSDATPDLVLVLGDRGEMLAATLAAVHLGIHVAHIHGGERSGTLDESFRHAISKLAHYHFPTTDEARQRLERMGERPDHIVTIGAPGLVGLRDGLGEQPPLAERFDLSAQGLAMLVVFHPVVQEAAEVGVQVETLLDVLRHTPSHGVIFRPNSDAGAAEIERAIDAFQSEEGVSSRFAILDHLERDAYLGCMQMADIMLGNSSSGIIESASFGTACVNIGSRQNGRQRNDNTVHCQELTREALSRAIDQAAALTPPFCNQYGDGAADKKLYDAICGLSFDPADLSKFNQY